MTGEFIDVPAGGTAGVYAPIVLSNFNLRGARFPLYLGVSTTDDPMYQSPIAIMDAGVSFIKPDWWYNFTFRNQGPGPVYVPIDFRYLIAPFQSPGFYGGTYDDATTLTYAWNEQTSAPAVSLLRIDMDDTGTTAVGSVAASLYVSTDGGSTWTVQMTGLNTPTAVQQVCLARSAPSIMYCAIAANAAGPAYLYKSTDKGLNWTALTSSPLSAWRVVKCNYDGTIVLAGQTNGKLYLSLDGGATWTAQSTGVTNLTWTSVYVSDDGTLLVGARTAGGQLWVSSDSGATWTQRGTMGIWVYVTGTSDGSLLYAGRSGGTGVFFSRDRGVTWTDVLYPTAIYQIAMSVNGNKIAVSGIFGSDNVYLTQDGGTTWGAISGAPAGTRFGLAMTPDGIKLLLGGNSSGSLRPYTITQV